MKKAIAFILSCSLTAAAVLQGIPANAAGAAEAEIAVQSVSGEFEYKVTDEEMKSCQVTGYTGDEAEIAVPETLDGGRIYCGEYRLRRVFMGDNGERVASRYSEND